MELLYSASRQPRYKKDWTRDEWPICCLSPRNIIAFTSVLDLEGKNGNKEGPMEDVYHVYVCDIDKPWDLHLVVTFVDNILWLHWNSLGTALLVVTSAGECQVWEMVDYLLNDWQCTNTITLDGQDIVAAAWIHSGVKVNFLAENKDKVQYTDKMVRTKFSPSVSHFGGKPTEGFVLVTSTGMVNVGLLKTGSSEVQIKSDSLLPWRARVMIADITYDSNGDIICITSDGSLLSAIQCYRVSVKVDQGNMTISSKSVASLYARCHLDTTLRDSPTSRISHLRFLPTECGTVLIVGAGDTNNSHVELWNLTEELMNLHRLYQQAGGPDANRTTHRWIHKTSVTHESMPISIAIPRFPVVYSVSDSQNAMFQYVAVAYRDGSVKLINRNNFQPMATTNLDTGISLEECDPDRGEKRRRVIPFMVNMQQTLTGCVLVGVDQYSTMYVMKAINTRDQVTRVPLVYLVSMFEYAIMIGADWWDLLAALRQEVIENVIQKLSDNFQKQPGHVQELFYARFMAIKGSLYRVSANGQQRAADTHCQLMLHSIGSAFKAALRPLTMNTHDMSPAEKLTNCVSKSYELDIDKLILLLSPEKKEFSVEPATLQAMQPLIQWVADLVLYLLTSPALLQNYANFPGRILLHDSGSLNSLRELLVLIRMWGFNNSGCLPHFTSTSPFDCLVQLFKLLTKVWMLRKENKSFDLDEGLMDECCLLPSQVVVPGIDQGLFGDTNYENSIFFQNYPMQYTFSVIPSHSVKSSRIVLPDGQIASQQKRDIVKQVNLGVNPPSPMKKCIRCNCLSQLDAASSSKAPSIVRAWELRWAKMCPCGGHWKVIKNTSLFPS